MPGPSAPSGAGFQMSATLPAAAGAPAKALTQDAPLGANGPRNRDLSRSLPTLANPVSTQAASTTPKPYGLASTALKVKAHGSLPSTATGGRSALHHVNSRRAAGHSGCHRVGGPRTKRYKLRNVDKSSLFNMKMDTGCPKSRSTSLLVTMAPGRNACSCACLIFLCLRKGPRRQV